ncbi:MAG: lytic transglycosylase domain-containing protein [Alphaproteobacteria bacterium]
MSISGDLFKTILIKHVEKHTQQLWRLLHVFPIPTSVLVILGILAGSSAIRILQEPRVTSLESRLKISQDREDALQKDYNRMKDLYEAQIHAQENLIQQGKNTIEDILMTRNDMRSEIIYFNAHDQKKLISSNADQSESQRARTDTAHKTLPQPETILLKAGIDPPFGRIATTVENQDELPTEIRDNSPENEASPPISCSKISAKVIAACLIQESQTYRLPAATLIGIMHVEGGRVGQEIHNKDGSYSLGPMLINTRFVPELANLWNVDKRTAHTWVRDNGCVNMYVASWRLRQTIDTAGDLYKGIALFHSTNKKDGENYADKVIAAMKEKGFVITGRPPQQKIILTKK